MRPAQSGSRGVFWRANPRGSQDRKLSDGHRQRGDWWIRWTCPHGHLHREQVGPKALAQKEAERHRIERPCPARAPKPTSYMFADIINEYLSVTRKIKRSWKDDDSYGGVWKARFTGRTLDEITPAEPDRLRSDTASVVQRRCD